MSDKVYYLVDRLEHDEWVRVDFEDLTGGDIFTLTDPVTSESRKYIALSNAYFDEDFQELTILTKPYEGDETSGEN